MKNPFRLRTVSTVALCFVTAILGVVGASRALNKTWRLEEEVVILQLQDERIAITKRFLRALQWYTPEEWGEPDLGEKFRRRFNDPDAPKKIRAILQACGGPKGSHAFLHQGFGIYYVYLERFGTAFENKKDPWRWQVFQRLPDETGSIKVVNVKDEALARQIASPLLGGSGRERKGAAYENGARVT